MPYIEGDGGQKGRKSWRPVKATPRDTNRHSTSLGQLSVYTNLIAGLIPVQNRLPFACPTALNTNANNATTFVGLDVHVRSIKDCAFAPATGETERKSLGCDHQQARIVDEVPAPACETRLRVRRDRLPPVPQAARHGRRLQPSARCRRCTGPPPTAGEGRSAATRISLPCSWRSEWSPGVIDDAVGGLAPGLVCVLGG